MCSRRMPRREVLNAAAGGLAGAGALAAAGVEAGGTGRPGAEAAGGVWAREAWRPEAPLLVAGKPLRVQPVLVYAVRERREAASWKSWGGVQSEAAAEAEVARIAEELRALERAAGFPLEIAAAAKVRSPEEAERSRASPRDVTIVYPASGSGDLLVGSVPESGPSLIFVRHRSGPVYYWYEALSTRYLAPARKPAGGERPLLGGASVLDVVVDEPGELLARLRALRGALSLRGMRIVALGGPWGKYAPEAPARARDLFGLEIVDVSYAAFQPRLAATLADPKKRARAEARAAEYLAIPGTELATPREFVVGAFVLHALFRELLEEHGAQAFTIKECMSTILPMSRTTACLALSVLNDEGHLAFCESDFVAIPAGILLRVVSGRPAFLHNSTFPHRGVVTCAHCTAPRRMDGSRYEPAKILTHYESDFGAAPKVEIPPGQKVTFIDPEYATGRWVGFRGRVVANPFYEICRSQQDVEILGDWKALLDEVRDSHWVMAYGDVLEEVGYAASKLGVRWEAIHGA
ncbi:MAG: sugar isomerase [Planctomycetota bacterium]